MGKIMTVIVAEGNRKKLFLSPTDAHIQVTQSVKPQRKPRSAMPNDPILVSGRGYGITHWHQLFTERQLIALETFSDLLEETRNCILQDGADSQYADAVCTFLSLAIGRATDSNSSFARWHNSNEKIEAVFSRQAIPMLWDFPEANPFSTSTQHWMAQVTWVVKVVENLPILVNDGEVYQADATTTMYAADSPVIVTDPPYYDNIQYAELSEFFYIWLRPLLRDIYPELFAGMTIPRDEEIVAAPRFENPPQHFEKLLGKALVRIRQCCPEGFPTSIFYAYKQQEREQDEETSTGWEKMLIAIVNTGFQIVATWPMRTEQPKALKTGINALASSVVLVCRPRPEDAPSITRNEFLQELKREMTPALDRLTRIANIRPVDLAQAAIGPGMEVYSRYNKVMRVSGEIVPIREALMHINNEITAFHEKETGELDPESQFCLTWLQQHGYTEGNFGDAEGLSKAKDVDIAAMHDKVLLSARGKVRLLRPEEYAERENSEDMTAWEGCLRMVWHLSSVEKSGGISGCTAVARAMRDYESAQRLARVLYAYYDARGDAESAARYNNLVTQWQYISQSMGSPEQMRAEF
jgi:putative DNA methylase